jgi:hypothetical protein
MLQAWENVELLLNEMRPLLAQAGIPERQLKMPDAKPEDIKTERFVEIFDWLHRLKLGNEYQQVAKVRRLVPEAQWERYQLFEITGLQEQLLLEQANIKLRKAWKHNRPHFFGRKFKSKDEEAATTEQDQNQENPE